MRQSSFLLLVVVSCSSSGNGVPTLQTLPYVDPDPGPAQHVVRTPSGQVYASFADGRVLRLGAGAGKWEVVDAPPIVGTIADFQSGLLLGVSSQGIMEIRDSGIVPLEPAVPMPAVSGGYGAIRARDASGKFRLIAAGEAAESATISVGEWSLGQASWTLTAVSLPIAHYLPATSATVTAAGQIFYRPNNSGIWEVDIAGKVTEERVACTHEMFRPSHPDYAACQQDTVLLTSAEGDLLAMNAMFEVWQLGSSASSPSRVVAGSPPNLPPVDGNGFSYYAISPQAPYAAPDGKLWLAFRWGDNTPDDLGYLFSAYPRGGGPWKFLRSDLPRNVQLFGAAAEPLIMNGSGDAGFELISVAQ